MAHNETFTQVNNCIEIGSCQSINQLNFNYLFNTKIMNNFKIYQIQFIPESEHKAHILSKALSCSDLLKTHAQKVGRKYFDIDGDEIENCSGDYEDYYEHCDIYEWKKLPSKKWCIEQIRLHFLCNGTSYEGCYEDLGDEHLDISIKLLEKYNI